MVRRVNVYCFRMQLVQLSMIFFMCSVAQDDSPCPLTQSCWYSMHHLNTLHFDSRRYFPLNDESNRYNPGWLFGSSFDLFFLQRICCKFFPTWMQYLSKFSWIHFLYLDWCLESKIILLDCIGSIFDGVFVVAFIVIFIIVFCYHVF